MVITAMTYIVEGFEDQIMITFLSIWLGPKKGYGGGFTSSHDTRQACNDNLGYRVSKRFSKRSLTLIYLTGIGPKPDTAVAMLITMSWFAGP